MASSASPRSPLAWAGSGSDSNAGAGAAYWLGRPQGNKSSAVLRCSNLGGLGTEQYERESEWVAGAQAPGPSPGTAGARGVLSSMFTPKPEGLIRAGEWIGGQRAAPDGPHPPGPCRGRRGAAWRRSSRTCTPTAAC